MNTRSTDTAAVALTPRATTWSTSWAQASLLLALFVLWSLIHPYPGLTHDALLYTLQALARLNPGAYANDVFLVHGSQDQYTLFSPFYAWVISRIGTFAASALLTFLFQIVFYAATYWLARRLVGKRLALLAVALVMALPSDYGSGNVFSYGEMFLSARLPAEAIGLLGFACLLVRWRAAAVVLFALSLVTHPLVATPLILLAVLMHIPDRNLPAVSGLGVAGMLLVALVAAFVPIGPLSLMDPQWLQVVEERSWFIFVEYWKLTAWHLTLVPLLTLVFVLQVLRDDTARALAVRALILAVGGLLFAFVCSGLLNVELVMQGQPWRWVWVARFLAIVMLPAAMLAVLRGNTLARLGGLLLALAWIAETLTGSALALAAVALAAVSGNANAQRYARPITWVGLAVALIIVAWLVSGAVLILSNQFQMDHEHIVIERFRDVLAHAPFGAILVTGAWYLAERSPRYAIPTLLGAAAVVLAMYWPSLHTQWFAGRYSERSRDVFAEWRHVIPPRTEVLWYEGPAAIWFLLDRPSFISRTQSAGVVFSPETARDIERRARAIEAVVDRDWIIGANPKTYADQPRDPKEPPVRRYTVELLTQVCQEPAIGFVITSTKLTLPHLAIRERGWWEGLRLYDCAPLRAPATSNAANSP